MKKIILTWVVLLGFTITVAAQESKTIKKEVKTTVKVVTKKEGTPDKRYKETKKTAVVLKKDGTPDKRYKENKKIVVLKKDGTPDKRYKETKKVVVVKKDGTPDKRYTNKK